MHFSGRFFGCWVYVVSGEESSSLLQATKAIGDQSAEAKQFRSTYSYSGTCCDSLKAKEVEFQTDGVLPMAAVIGTSNGACCTVSAGMSATVPYPLFSASKWISGIMVSRLVDDGLLTLDTKVSDVLDWWVEHDDVTVKKLLTQSDGMQNYPAGLGACEADTTVGCAKEAYAEAWPEEGQGQPWLYSETSFYPIGAIVQKLLKCDTYNDAFQQLLMPKIKDLNFGKCTWSYPSVEKSDPGGGMVCSATEFSKIIAKLSAGDLLSETSLDSLLKVNTDLGPHPYANFGMNGGAGTYFGVPAPAGHTFRYGLGHFQQVDDASGETTILSSLGMMGTLPWMIADSKDWGVFVRWDNAGSPVSWSKAYAFIAGAPTQFQLVIGNKRTNECPSGSEVIPTADMCKLFSEANGLAYGGLRPTVPGKQHQRPRGCWTNIKQNIAYFNADIEGGGSSSDGRHAAPACMKL